MLSCVGAMFQVGGRFGIGLTVWNSRAAASAGRKDAYRQHITDTLSMPGDAIHTWPPPLDVLIGRTVSTCVNRGTPLCRRHHVDRLCTGIAEYAFGAGIPVADRSLGIGVDHRIGR